MDNYIVVGGGILQIDFIRKVKENGLCVHVIDYDPNCAGADEADFFHCISITDREAVLALAKKICPVGIQTVATEQGNVTACYVGELLGLKCNSYQTAINTTNKLRMKEVLEANKISTSKFVVYKKAEDIDQQSFSFPVIVKPADSSAGRGVMLTKNYGELVFAIDDALSKSIAQTVLIEEYIDGQQFSVETLSCDGCHQVVGITEMGFSGAPFFVETEHVLPAEIRTEFSERIRKYVLAVLDAFSVKYGAGHIEIRIDSSGQIKLIEIASRMGGWRHWMIQGAMGIDFLQGILDTSLGRNYSVVRKQYNKVCVVKTISSLEDYATYKALKVANPEAIVADFVQHEIPKDSPKDLISTAGGYVVVKEQVKQCP